MAQSGSIHVLHDRDAPQAIEEQPRDVATDNRPGKWYHLEPDGGDPRQRGCERKPSLLAIGAAPPGNLCRLYLHVWFVNRGAVNWVVGNAQVNN